MAKSTKQAYWLWLMSIFGWLGLHRLYLGKKKTAILWICTFGFFGIGLLIDLAAIPWPVNRYNSYEKLAQINEALNLLRTRKEALVKAQKFEEAASCSEEERILETQKKRIIEQIRH